MTSVLYVDDETGFLQIAKLYLERSGDLTVTIADSAQKGLDTLKTRKFDAVISDYQMPVMDGISFLQEVRKLYGSLPFILFTGKGREEVVIKAINNGVDFYLQKGGDPRAQFIELKHKVHQAVTRHQAEKSFIESKKRLADIIDFLPDATFAIDKSGCVIAWNRAMEEMTGTAASEVIGRGEFIHSRVFYGEARPMLIDLVLSEDSLFEKENYLYTHRDATTLTAETVVHPSDGSNINIWGKASRLYDENGELAGAIESIRDITDRKTAEEALLESESRLRSFIEMTGEAVTLIDYDGKVIEWNPGSERIAGIPKEDVIGKYWWDIMYLLVPRERRTDERRILLERMIRNSLQTGTPLWNGPKIVEIERPNGTRVIARLTVFQIKTECGFRLGSIAQDITDEKRAEDAIRVSEEKYRSIFENSVLGIFQTTHDGRFITVNPAFASIFGYESPEQMLDEVKDITLQLYAHPEDRVAVLQALDEKGRIESWELPFLRRDGSMFWLSFTSRKVSNPDDSTAYLEGMVIDITEHKRAEKALKESDLRQRAFINASSDMAFLKDDSYAYLMINDSYSDFFGMDESKILGKNDFDLMPDEMARNCRLSDQQAIADDRLVINIETVDDRVYETRKFPVLVGEGRGVGGFIRDITDRVLAEKAVHEREEWFRSIVETSPDMIWEIDPKGNFRYISPLVKTFLGYAPDELIGKSILTLIPEHTHALTMQEIGKQVSAKAELFTIECPALHKDGNNLIIEIRSSPVIDEKGNVTGFRGIAHDITERRRVQTALEEREELYRALVATVPDLIVQTNLDGEITFINDYGAALGGFSSKSEAIGTPVSRYFAPEDLPRAIENSRLMFEQQLGPIEYVFVGNDGTRHNIEINGDVLRNTDGTPYGMVFAGRDITMRKKAEAAIKRAYQQLTMLYGITRHDILNNLMIILGNLEIARTKPLDPEIVTLIDKLEEKTLQIRAQIEFTRIYEELGSSEPLWQEISTVLSNIPVPGTVTVTDESYGTEIFADPILEKVFANLIDNTIRHGEYATEIHITAKVEGDGSLALVYDDNGRGIAGDEKSKIFERGYGKNTGLGLFLVREVLALTGITITENGQPGHGARFEIRVPDGNFRGFSGTSGRSEK